MSTVEKLEQHLETLRSLGYQIRYDYFGGVGAGFCEFAGKKMLFLDLALSSLEHLELVENELEKMMLRGGIPDQRAA